MIKNIDIHSKHEYKTPILDIEELEKQDVLTFSETDNAKFSANDVVKKQDLISSIFEDLGIKN